jgi:hypothetical protein
MGLGAGAGVCVEWKVLEGGEMPFMPFGGEVEALL